MSIVMYERVGLEQRRPSPFSWRIRYALTHKGLDVEYRPTRFADVETIKRLSGQQFVPIIVDGSAVIHDSWRIATYLEEKFPDRPTLFGDRAARAGARFINLWSDTALVTLRRLIYADFIWCLAPEDRTYFRESREKELGETLEAACADRPRWQARFEIVSRPLERLLGEQDFVAGDQPRYSDYIVFSVFQWARLGSPHDVVKSATALDRWRSRMIALFDGLADKFPPYPTDWAETWRIIYKKYPTTRSLDPSCNGSYYSLTFQPAGIQIWPSFGVNVDGPDKARIGLGLDADWTKSFQLYRQELRRNSVEEKKNGVWLLLNDCAFKDLLGLDLEEQRKRFASMFKNMNLILELVLARKPWLPTTLDVAHGFKRAASKAEGRADA